MNYAEINLAFKVLEFSSFFNEDFVKKVTNRLEEVLTPMDKPKEEEQENKE